MRVALPAEQEHVVLPPELTILEEVTGRPEYKNRFLASSQQL